jgi:hypothetical protein
VWLLGEAERGAGSWSGLAICVLKRRMRGKRSGGESEHVQVSTLYLQVLNLFEICIDMCCSGG